MNTKMGAACRLAVIAVALIGSMRIRRPGFAQAPGYADLRFPGDGEAVSGLVTIEGSASHPFFQAYDLAFAYQDDARETWFMITERATQQVPDGPLGIWDTSSITDGTYRLRLRVFLEGRETLLAEVEQVRVRNYSRVETPTPGAIDTPETPTPGIPTSTPRPTPLPVLQSEGTPRVLRAFTIGAALGAAGLLAGGFYLLARTRIRIRMGMMRTRRMLWQEERKRRKQG